MSDTVFLGRKMRSFDSSPQFDGYSKVIITINDEVEYSAGDDLGRTLRITNPWGTPQMARDILERVRGFQYQPYTAEDAILNPAAELGDGITANNVYGGIYTKKIKFGPMLTATVSAPEDEELNHEYPYKSKPNKEITREAKLLRAEMRIQADRIELEVSERKSDVQAINGKLSVQADLISAKVSKTGGNPSSFGWNLTDDSWTIEADNREILKATINGLEVYGKITATSGKIGGFDINSNYLSYNHQAWNGTNSTGVYLGIQGIQCGSKDGGVRITSNGILYAEHGEFRGSVRAKNIQFGGNDGYFSGYGISSGSISGSRLLNNTVSTPYLSTGVLTSLGYADSAYAVTSGAVSAPNFYSGTLYVSNKLYLAQRQLYLGSVTIDGTSYNVVRWQ